MVKIKLLIVADTFYPKVDGILKFVEEFTKRAKDHFDLHYLVPNLGRDSPSLSPEKVTKLEISQHLSLSGYPSIRFSLRNLASIKEAVQRSDLIFIQGPAVISYLAVYYAQRLKKRTVFYHHIFLWELFEKFAPPPFNRWLSFLIKKLSILLYNRCDEILVPYHELVAELERIGVRTRITVAKLGVDIDIFSPSLNKRLDKQRLNIDHHKKVIGYVGRISREKNVDQLIAAFKKLRKKDQYVLLLVGGASAEEEESIRSEVSNSIVTGFVTNVQDYLKAMDIFVMPSLTETTSLATLEAMASGLPVLATKVGFIKNYLIKDHNGQFFPKNSSTILAIKIEKLLSDQHLRDELGKNARKTVAYSFSWERSISRIKKILSGIRESGE